MSDIAIEVRNVGKKYKIGNVETGRAGLNDILVDALTLPLRRMRSLAHGQVPTYMDREIWALRDVSFDVKQGETIGIAGLNGSGKSTLLKIISHIVKPTEGYVKTRGRISTLLEVGTGFHNELTGRENVYINGAILGMTRDEITRQFDQILQFAEISEFIDTPIKRYSTGMRMRLAFSVAIHLRPEIMIFDEVLAVGDPAFRQKCVNRIAQVHQDTTVVIVTHSVGFMRQLCDRVIWMDKGRVFEVGEATSVLTNYQRAIMPETLAGSGGLLDLGPDENKKVNLRKIAVLDRNDKPTPRIESGEPLRVQIEYVVNEPIIGAHTVCYFEDSKSGATILGIGDADVMPLRLEAREAGRYVGEFELPPFLLNPGVYHLTVSLEIPFGEVFDKRQRAVTIRVVDTKSTRSRWYPQMRPGFLGIEVPWLYTEQPGSNGAHITTEEEPEQNYS